MPDSNSDFDKEQRIEDLKLYAQQSGLYQTAAASPGVGTTQLVNDVINELVNQPNPKPLKEMMDDLQTRVLYDASY